MDGLLVIDKPSGPTSHDVVARMRRALGEKRIGHTGTLDPAATGVLPLVLGRATRLARFLSASDKSYEAVVRLGFSTDTADAQGRPTGSAIEGALPSRQAIDAALDAFRGTFLQQPPAFSAKKIDGKRSHKIARARERAETNARLQPSRYEPEGSSHPGHPAPPAPPALPALPAPVTVTAHAIEILSVDRDTVTLRVDCSAGFYVRSLAHDLGERLGTGGHVAALRRTRSGDFTLDHAIDLDTAERDPRRAAALVIPLANVLPRLASVVLTAEGVNRAVHGRDLGPGDTSSGEPFALSPQPSALSPQPSHQPWVRLIDPRGELVAIARPTGAGGLLHPSVVLM
jgi:tRNA pseudouridine55 synthase